jgi:hypothetical protein
VTLSILGLELSTRALSIAAVAISLLSVGWSIGWSIFQHWRTTRGRLYVKAAFATTSVNPVVVAVTVTNAGLVPLTVTSIEGYVEGVTGKRLVLTYWRYQSKPLSVVLTPGESWSGHHDVDILRDTVASLAPARSTQTVTFVARDAADRTYKGNPLDF